MPKLGLRWLLLGHNGNGEKSAAGNPVTAPQGR
jgi:hypothetical protein